MLVWLESRQRCKRYIIFSEFFTYYSPPVTLKMRSRSTLKLVPMIYPCKFGDIPSVGSRDIVDTRICHADADADADAENLTVLGLL